MLFNLFFPAWVWKMTCEEDFLIFMDTSVCMEKKKKKRVGGAPIFEPWMMIHCVGGCLDWLVVYHNLMNATEMFVH